jgi:hypothetical protein
MSSTNEQKNAGSGNSKRGLIVVAALSSVVVIALAALLLTPPPPMERCQFVSDSSIKKDSQQAAVVLAPTSNFVNFESVAERASDAIADAIRSGSEKNPALAIGNELSIVLADSTPSLIVHSVVDSLGSENENDVNRAIDGTLDYVEVAAGCAGGDIQTQTDKIAMDPESDLLKGIKIAADQLDTTGNKDLFVLGNGIQTAGAILMQNPETFPASTKAAQSLAKSLFNKGELPDLKGISVTWFGLGQVDGEIQKPLPLAYVKALKEFWIDVIELSGGSVTQIYEEYGTGAPNENSLDVSLVVANPCPLIVKLYEADGVEFKADSSDFVSRSLARTAAESTVSKFKEENCTSLTVTGWASAGQDLETYNATKGEIDETNSSLTKRRAEAFAQLLLESGFDGEISHVGAGTCGTEWDELGKLIPSEQRLCRRVEVSN